jgi:mannose-6-phosphate isomerase-like protein (cupin superfamily)
MYSKVISVKESLLKPPISQKLKSGCVILKPGTCVGEHCTDNKEEILLVLNGTAEVEIEGEKNILSEHMIGYIPEGKRHNVWNISKKDLRYIYIVTPI